MTPPLRPDDAMQPATASEVNNALAERMMTYRAVKSGLLGYAALRGWIFPVELRRMDPDYVEGE